MASRRSFALSPQQVDPLSWFTGPLVPLAFAALSVIYGLILTAYTWSDTPAPLLQVVAVMLSACSGLAIHFATRPLRRPLGWRSGALLLAPAVTGVLVSALGYGSTPFRVEFWWAPEAPFSIEFWWAPSTLALAIASLGPYLPVRKLLGLGGGATVVSVACALAILHPGLDQWGVVGAGVIIAYPPVLGTAATAVFSYSVVSTMLRMLESPSRIMVAGQTVRDEIAEQIERVTVARLTARAAPFLEGIADAGRITPADRALAGQLARRLRDDLVTQSNLSWLDSIASESRLVVVDPDRRAQGMNNAQRTALRAMLRAIVETPGIDSGSLMVELRAAPDGATAVGVSLDMTLPEGKRIMHLAPYYLTLRTAVDDLVVSQDDLLRLTFRIAPD